MVTGSVSCDGDLVEDETGWRWRGPRGEVTMGRVTVFDAEGETVPARFEVTPTTTRLVVEGSALLAAAYPVVMDPELGSNDYRISDMGGVGDPDYDAFDAAVAYNSITNEYLVVWWGDDNTGGLVDYEHEVFGQLLSATGGQVVTNDFRISDAGGTGNATSDAFHPDVAFNSTYNQYLVVWHADDPVDGVVDNEFEIWGQVLDADGGGLYANDFRISFNGGRAMGRTTPTTQLWSTTRTGTSTSWCGKGTATPAAWCKTRSRSGRNGSTPPASWSARTPASVTWGAPATRTTTP